MVEVATHVCRLAAHDIASLTTLKLQPAMLRLSSLQLSLSESVYPVRPVSSHFMKVMLTSALQCTGKLNLLKAQFCAFNTSDSTTIPLTVQNWQITSFVVDSTDFVVDSSNICLAVQTVGMQRCPGFHKNVSFPK